MAVQTSTRKVARITSAAALERRQKQLAAVRQTERTHISVCGGTACLAAGAQEVADALIAEINKRRLSAKVELKQTGCHGLCSQGPVVVIGPQKVFYRQVTAGDVSEIVAETVAQGKVIERLLYVDPVSGRPVTGEGEIPFYAKQTKTITGLNESIDPTDIRDYLAAGGYSALAKALKMDPQAIIDEVKKSGLRGRGGAGYPAGSKWQAVRNAVGETKYTVCNGDEGDPGSFQDGTILEGNPHSVLEGMIIAAFAVGSHDGHVYIRNEYPLAVKRMQIAIDQAKEYGLIGENILGSGFDFAASITRGGGAFVCGESSALLASIEGKIGEPRAKYTHMSDVGLWELPTLLNNVKTFANVPLIINEGGGKYAETGTAGSKGTAIFSLVGKINNAGLVEVPMGITLREMIFGIGGGIPNGKQFKAVQTGGPLGGCLPAEHLDTPVDFDELTRLGSAMGCGGMTVMDEDNCMVDMARHFVDFLKDESCGKCVPCREGLLILSDILRRITEGQGTRADLDVMADISGVLKVGALCALGTGVPTPVLSSLRYFRDEYLAHIDEKRCPAGVCRGLKH